MTKKKICFIAQFPPPVHGLSKAVETLYYSEITDEFELEKIDIKNNKHILRTLWRLAASKADLFYFTISQSKGGNLRDLLILKVLELRKKKCLIHLHGGYYRKLVDTGLPAWQKRANYRAISNLNGVIVLGASLKSIFEGMIPDERILIVPNCVEDMYLLSEKELEEKTSTLAERSVKHVLYLSNFIRTKGYPQVLEMAKMEKERVEAGGEPLFHFNFAGKFFEKAEEDYFWYYVKKNQLEKYITYHGIVSGEKKQKLLKMCDIFVLLTKYPNEGQPISIIEAMGNGMVIVATAHAGIPDIVKDGINGIVVNDDKELNNVYFSLCNYTAKNYYSNAMQNYSECCNKYQQKVYIAKMRYIFRELLS